MAKKVAKGYACTFCEKIYPTPALADSCRDSHEIMYVPFTATELNRLINALYSGDLSIIPENVFVTLKKVQRKSVTDGVQKKV